jgi:hypothetical protein
MLGVLLHAPRGPFYSPKAARSRCEQSRKAILAFCREVHQTVRCWLLSYSGVADRRRFGAVGAPDNLMPPPDRWLGHASRADCAADCWLTGQSGAPPDSPVNYSRTPPSSSRERPVDQRQPGAPNTIQCTTRQSGAPRLNNSWLYTANSFSFCLFSDSST